MGKVPNFLCRRYSLPPVVVRHVDVIPPSLIFLSIQLKFQPGFSNYKSTFVDSQGDPMKTEWFYPYYNQLHLFLQFTTCAYRAWVFNDFRGPQKKNTPSETLYERHYVNNHNEDYQTVKNSCACNTFTRVKYSQNIHLKNQKHL